MYLLAMDVAASEFHKDGKYDLDFKNPETAEDDWISSDDLLEMYKVSLNASSSQTSYDSVEGLPCRLPGRISGRSF